MNNYQNFDFIQEKGIQISDLLFSQTTLTDWVQSVRDEYNYSCEFPEETFSKLNEITKSDKDLNGALRGICFDPDCPENSIILFQYIFFPESKEDHQDENYEEEQNENDFDIDDSFSQEIKLTMTSEELEMKQNDQIENLSNILEISKDVSLLLLKRYNWSTDRIVSDFCDNHQEILNLLHIKEEDLNNSLSFRVIKGNFECGICFCECDEIYELYCAHKFCRECWCDYIKSSVEKGSSTIHCMEENCDAEIMPSDVSRLCGEEIGTAYKKYILDEQVNSNNQLLHCTAPGCKNVLTLESVGICNIATCPCGKRICWKCKEDVHVPMKCGQMKEWNDCAESMLCLVREQRKWENREKKIMEWRRNHIGEIQSFYEEKIEKSKQEKVEKDENERTEIERLIAQFKSEPNNQEIKEKIEKKEREHKINEQERQKEIESLENELHNFLIGIRDSNYSDFYMRNVRESEELREWSKREHTTEELLDHITRKCPKCGRRIEKDGGCNFMQCSQCSFQFCWVCGSDWSTHGDHFICNKFDGTVLNEVDDEDIGFEDNEEIGDLDPKDFLYKKQSLPPMNEENITSFNKFNHYFKRYMMHIKAHKLELKYRDSYRQNLLQDFLHEMSERTANEFIHRIFKAIDIARSTLTFSYPAAYLWKNGSRGLIFFETYQSNLEIAMEKLVGMVERNLDDNTSHFEHFTEMLEKYTNIMLSETDKYMY
ncbi:hypothetical protein TRFO_22590 [Tritrichomonas foetus]|uniref:RBR-type E3 ubiquitin transferase n=1 Tax=Tritrichomonas foetus TaxID=1144522 RepID=A0A1J4KGA3_9EUKA|nr:hypothetical protein TRFO_22590 [Tritrichomonas foetus]|eukprot:OHT08828.1 hypothetical protein TRFO_22590 [Tritrichomonas foetus]